MNYQIEKSKNGELTLYTIRDGRKYYLHSKYNPSSEAENIIRSYKINKYNRIIILGTGIGYVIKSLVKKVSSDTKLYIIEKDEELFEIFKKNNQTGSGEIEYIVNKSPEEVSERIMTGFDIAHDKGILLIEIPSIVRLHQKYYTQVKLMINNSIEAITGQQMTLAKLGASLVMNLFKNLMQIEKFKIIEFDNDKINNKYALVVSAGPSLEKDIKVIKEYQDKVYIFAVDTVLNYLLNNEVIPDYVFTFDPQFQSKYHFDNIKIPDSTVLFVDIFSHFIIPRTTSKVGLVLTNNFFIDNLFDKGVIKLDADAGSVTNFIYQFLVKIGFKNIIFSGLDLSYKKDEFYVPYTYIYRYIIKRVKKFKPLKNFYYDFFKKRAKVELEISGKKYPTSHSMQSYYNWLKKNLLSNLNIYVSKNSVAKIETMQSIDINKLNMPDNKEVIHKEKEIDYKLLMEEIKKLQKNIEFKNELTAILFYSLRFDKTDREYDTIQIDAIIDKVYNKLRQLNS